MQRIGQRCVVRLLLQKFAARNEKMTLLCLQLSELVTRKKRSMSRLLITELKSAPLQSAKLQINFAIIENLINGKIKAARSQAFALILGQSIVSKNQSLLSVIEKLQEGPRPARSKDLRAAVAVAERKLELLATLLRKKQRSMQQDLRRAFQTWVSETGESTVHATAKSFRKLATLVSHRHTSDLLRGYYGIKAAGGRLDKLFIIVSKKQKIYTAKVRYCIKKLRIWNKFKSNVSEDYGNVKTIIVRTENSHEDQRTTQLQRMFFRKGLDGLQRVFRQAREAHVKDSLAAMKLKWRKSSELQNLFTVLHQSMYARPLKQGWIELSIFNLQQKTIRLVTSSKKESYYESPNGKQRTGNKAVGGVTNPLFKYIEERSHERGTFIDHESNNTNLSSEIEIFKSGLDLDEKLRKISNSKQLQGAKSLELALKADQRFGSSPEVMKASNQRVILLCLPKLMKRRLYQAFESIKQTDTKDKMKKVAVHFFSFGLERTEKLIKKILLRSKHEAVKVLKSTRPPKQPTTPSKGFSLYKDAGKKVTVLAFHLPKGSKDHGAERPKGYR